MAGNKYSWRRKLTAEKAAQIAHILRTENTSTLNSAAARVDLPGTMVVQTIKRFERGEAVSELDEEIGAVLYAAHQAQLDLHRQSAEAGSVEGNATLVGWKKWRLETAAPLEHTRIAKTELSGPDEGPVEVVQLTALPFHELLQLASGETDPGPSGEKN